MTVTRYRSTAPYAATATALLLSLPSIGDPTQTSISLTAAAQYQALGKVGVLVAESIAPSVYSRGSSEVLATLLLDVAARLLTQSKSLDSDFSAVVDQEFWNLL
jgi:hypothetical protein